MSRGMAMMYGTPPMAPGWGREAADKLAKALEESRGAQVGEVVQDTPEHHAVQWLGVVLVWDGRCFQGAGDGWAAQVFPDGVRWKADLQVCGGRREGFGLTPAEGLNEARIQWRSAVAKLAEVDAP
jgi:hypothetical protein